MDSAWDQATPGMVLFEFTKLKSSQVGFFRLSQVMRRKGYGQAAAVNMPEWWFVFLPRIVVRFLLRIWWYVGNPNARNYESFGVTALHVPIPTLSNYLSAFERARAFFAQNPNKKDIEDLAIDGVQIGDLIYDSYLKRNSVPTIPVGTQDWRLWVEVWRNIAAFLATKDQFGLLDVGAVVVSHAVYEMGIVSRIAISQGITCLQVSGSELHRLVRERPRPYMSFLDYPEEFATLPKDVRQRGREFARRRLLEHVSGGTTRDMPYMRKSSFAAQTMTRLPPKREGKKRILVAAHSFFDSPHLFGNCLFPDFFEWIEFLGELSTRTDYEWLIKPHPNYGISDVAVLGTFAGKYNSMLLLPPETSHKEIIQAGVDLVLTVYGSIGFEYAEFGIPVVNASLNNPHIRYDFSFHPENKRELEDMIRSVDQDLFLPNHSEIDEYYFMRHLYETKNIFFPDWGRLLEEVGGPGNLESDQVLIHFLEVGAQPDVGESLADILRFLDSGAYRYVPASHLEAL